MKILRFFVVSLIFFIVNTHVFSLTNEWVTPLNGYSPNIKDNSDLVYFDKIIDGATVVGLGESTHGTSEFFQMKHRLFKHLVEQQGFTIFAMENSMAVSAQVNEYILNGIGDPRALLKTQGMSYPYGTEEVLDLVKWMHDYNLTTNKKIKFYGIDMQDSLAINNIISLLAKTSLKKLQDTSFNLQQTISQNDAKFRMIFKNIQEEKPFQQILEEFNEFTADCKNLNSKLEDFSADLKNNKLAIEIQLGKFNYSWLLQNVKLLQEYTMSSPGQLSNWHPLLPHIDTINPRDQAMADNLMWIKSQFPQEKIVLWAHSGHVQKTREFGMGPSTIAGFNWVTLGTHLKEILQDQYRAITFITVQGSYTALNPVSFKIGTFPLQTPPLRTLEDMTDKICMPIALINLRDKDQLPNFLWQPIKARQVGSGADPDGEFIPLGNTSAAFDGIIFIKESTASKNFFFDSQLDHAPEVLLGV